MMQDSLRKVLFGFVATIFPAEVVIILLIQRNPLFNNGWAPPLIGAALATLISLACLRAALSRPFLFLSGAASSSEGDPVGLPVSPPLPEVSGNRLPDIETSTGQTINTLIGATLNALPDFVRFKDGEGRWIEANEQSTRLLRLENIPYRGKKDAELVSLLGSHWGDLLDSEWRDEEAWEAGCPTRCEETVVLPEGRCLTLDVARVPLFDAAGRRKALILIGRDISDLKNAQRHLEDQLDRIHRVHEELQTRKSRLEEVNARLERQVVTDGLTGLKNHRAFQERLDEEYRRARRYGTPLSLILLDVDHFKRYNDTFGHPAGDELLKQIARILKRAARASDIVARYGGEEFILILPNTDVTGARTIAERLRLQIAAISRGERAVTASFGISALNPKTGGRALLVAEADKALYTSKQNGRNRITLFAEPDISAQALVSVHHKHAATV